MPINEELNFEDAKENCKNNNAKLFEPRNIHENEFVMNLTQNQSMSKFWIGIRRGLDGKSVYSSDNLPITWSHFSALDKIENPQIPNCAVISMGNGMGEWKNQDCTMKKHSVCDTHIGKSSFHIF